MTLYDRIGVGYANLRRSDPRIGAAILSALGDAHSIVNVGAGTGSYEPAGRPVLAIEPSDVMMRQRASGAAPCIRASAEALPLETASYDAAMALLTIHHWTDAARGLRELRRVARRRVVLLTWVPDAPAFWLTEDYFPEIRDEDRRQFPAASALNSLVEAMIGLSHVSTVMIPHDCTDGFLGAYWRRPECYLSTAVRSAISSFSRFDPSKGLARLRSDIESGRWAERNADILRLDEMDLGYRLVRCELADESGR